MPHSKPYSEQRSQTPTFMSIDVRGHYATVLSPPWSSKLFICFLCLITLISLIPELVLSYFSYHSSIILRIYTQAL